jgi:alpha-1,3-rhamnosyl/mannosyltransferase
MRRIGLRHAGYTLCVATLEPRKNIANLIHAYARLPAGLRLNYPLVLAGSRGWNSQEIYDLIEKYTKQGWLRYVGYISELELPILYSAARILAYPSWYEGFGLPVLEAMASGVPVVASDRTSLPELTRGHALHVPPGDIHALESAINRALEDNSWRQEVIDNALNTAATYSWDNCIQSTLSTYRKLG